MRRPSDPTRLALRPLVVLTMLALASCASQKKGFPGDDQPTLATLARTAEVPQDKKIASNEEQTITAYRKFLEVAPKAPARRGHAPPRRPRDGRADQRSAAGQPASGPRPRRGEALPEFLKAFPDDKGQRPRPLPARACAGAGRRSRDRAEDARPPGRQLPQHAVPRRGQLPPRRAAVLAEGLCARRASPTAPCSARSTAPVQRPRAVHAGLVALQAGQAGRCAAVLLRRARRAPRRSLGSEGSLETLPGLSRADRELLEDTFRVTSISLANLGRRASRPTSTTRSATPTSTASTSSSPSSTSSRSA